MAQMDQTQEPALGCRPLFTARSLRLLIVPLMVEQFLAVTIGMADTVMVASVGEAAVSGISLVDSINILLIQVFSALATGGAVVASQYIGRGERENACSAAKQLIYAIFIMATIIAVLSLVFCKTLLHGVFGSIEPAVMQNAETYFVLSALSYPFLALYNGGAALFRSMGNSKISMFTSLMMNVVNISGNAILIYGFGWGVEGAATASLVSRALGAIVIITLVTRKALPVHVQRLWKPELRPQMLRAILGIGLPNGMENGMFQIGKLIVQRLIALLGTAAIAANAIANTVASISNIPGSAIGLAMITVIGQCVGARDYDQAVGYARKLMKVTYLATGALNLLIIVLIGPLVNAFGLSAAAGAGAREVLYLCTICAIFIWPLAFVLPNVLRAAGDAKFTMLVSMFSMWTFRIGFSYVLVMGFQMGLLGVWVAMIIDWAVRSAIFTTRFLRGKWKRARVI